MDEQDVTFSFHPVVRAGDTKPYVQFEVGDVTLMIAAEAARLLAYRLLRCAARAECDAVVRRELSRSGLSLREAIEFMARVSEARREDDEDDGL